MLPSDVPYRYRVMIPADFWRHFDDGIIALGSIISIDTVASCME